MFYLYIDNQQYGPYTMDQLNQFQKEGTLTKETYVAKEGGEWALADNVPELRPLFAPKAPEMPSSISASQGGLVYGGAGGIHTTSVQNNDYSQHVDQSQHIDNSKTIYDNATKYYYQTTQEAQKTDTQIEQGNEERFIQRVRELVQDGLTKQEEALLEQFARDCHINPLRAKEIIEAERKSAETLAGGQGNEYYASKVLGNVYDAVNANQPEIAKRLFKSLEEIAKTMDDGNIQYYYFMLFASTNPAGCTVSFVNHHTDNYWQLFWTCIAYIKLGQIQNATALMPRLQGFGGTNGDIDLLTAIENLVDFKRTGNEFYSNQLQKNLASAVNEGMSEMLSPLWYAVQELTKEKQEPETWYAYYLETTLQELTPKKEKSMQNGMPQMPTPPAMPKFDPQAVQLKQSQGWNPLQAAQQMGIGQMPSMQDMQAQLNAMRSQVMGSMPQMPGMSTPPPMPQGMPTMPQMPQAPQGVPQMPSMPQAPATPVVNEQEELVIPEPSDLPPSTGGVGRVSQYGIIFTDSLALAEKYGCDVQDVYNVLNEFIQNSAQVDQNWYLLDAGNYRQQLDRTYWGDYNELLSNYISENGFQVGLATPVFIIGGGDVIPVPQLENPQYGGMIPTDMAYCFGTTFFSDLWDGDRHISADYVRNTVSRLPLETGQVQTSIQDDLLSYFNLCSIVEDGIDIEGVVMASNVEWTDNSVTMSQHLPLIYTRTQDEEEIYKRMYMCPKLVAVESGGEEVDEKVLDDYQQAIRRAGMLLFNLHGSDGEGDSGFYCNSENGYPESFNIDLMRQSNARVFNTVACFGARYDGYERNDSMLMSSLLGGGKLLYAGSTISVPMIGDESQNYPEGVTQYPGSGSEKFMPLYCYYQFCGLPAGQAMMQAKLDYFNTFRHIERDDFSLSTAMMFGLYGNPMLHVKARQDVIDEALRYDVLPQLPETKTSNAPVRMKRKKVVLSKEQLHSSKSLLDQLRGCVDQNLNAIHEMVQQNLYNQLGLDPRWLDEVEEYEMFSGLDEWLSGYIYNYDNENKYGRKSIIEVSKQGEITRKVTFK